MNIKKDLFKAIKANDKDKILSCMQPLIFKAIKNKPINDQQDYYQELAIEIIKTSRRCPFYSGHKFESFLEKNNLLI